jgi:hypothetical protein
LRLKGCLQVLTSDKKENNAKNPIPFTVPLKLRLTRISTCLGGPCRLVSCSKYWLAGLRHGRGLRFESARAYHYFQCFRKISRRFLKNFTCNSSPVIWADQVWRHCNHQRAVSTAGLISPNFCLGRLANQRAFPYSEQQLFELGEPLRTKLIAPFALDFEKYVVGFCVHGVPTFGEADDSGAAFVQCVGPDDITETFQTAEEFVHGLLAHPGAFGEGARSDPVWTWKLQDRHMRYAKPLKTRRAKLFDDAALDRLRWDAQQRPNEHVLDCDGHFLLDILSKLSLQSDMVN